MYRSRDAGRILPCVVFPKNKGRQLKNEQFFKDVVTESKMAS
uniref:Uncharacterized protein n=1 Tax=Arundo donax TaxID=35708 RepID=A0A0A8Z9Q4_ARUDO